MSSRRRRQKMQLSVSAARCGVAGILRGGVLPSAFKTTYSAGVFILDAAGKGNGGGRNVTLCHRTVRARRTGKQTQGMLLRRAKGVLDRVHVRHETRELLLAHLQSHKPGPICKKCMKVTQKLRTHSTMPFIPYVPSS